MNLSLICSVIGITLVCAAQDFVNLNFDFPDLSGSLRPYEPSNPRTPFIGETHVYCVGGLCWETVFRFLKLPINLLLDTVLSL